MPVSKRLIAAVAVGTTSAAVAAAAVVLAPPDPAPQGRVVAAAGDPPPAVADVAVAEVQRGLTSLRYYVGAIDGVESDAVRSAVMAFQKVNGLTADGVAGPETRAALAAPVEPILRTGPADRVEIDLTKQVLYLVDDGALVRIMPVSSGNGDSYGMKDGSTARALTPVGTYQVERRIKGIRKAELGELYDPLYFYKGWAIHGSLSVPAHPASHGCVRVTLADARWLFDRVPVGTAVVLYGGTHTFPKGDEARAGTSAPAGDSAVRRPRNTRSRTDIDVKPAPAPAPSPSPSPAPSPSPSPTPSPTPTDDTSSDDGGSPGVLPPADFGGDGAEEGAGPQEPSSEAGSGSPPAS